MRIEGVLLFALVGLIIYLLFKLDSADREIQRQIQRTIEQREKWINEVKTSIQALDDSAKVRNERALMLFSKWEKNRLNEEQIRKKYGNHYLRPDASWAAIDSAVARYVQGSVDR